MTTRQHSSFAIVFILGLLAMLMPLSIDMYLPALPVISAQFGVCNQVNHLIPTRVLVKGGEITCKILK
ncbi:hypothetical protein BKK29_000869 [Escherichia coli]|nr:hypothetical protein [Escherichia coli]